MFSEDVGEGFFKDLTVELKNQNPASAFLCQSSTGWRTNFTYYIFSIYLTIISWAYHLGQVHYTCGNKGLSNTEPQN